MLLLALDGCCVGLTLPWRRCLGRLAVSGRMAASSSDGRPGVAGHRPRVTALVPGCWRRSGLAAASSADGHSRPAATSARLAGQTSCSCPVLQVLLAVYFFLAGVAVSSAKGRLLWLMPLAAVACALLLGVLAVAFKALSPSYRCCALPVNCCMLPARCC